MNYSNLESYVSTKELTQHSPNMPNGIDAFKNFLTTQDFMYDFVFKIIGEGNYVVSYSKVIFNKQDLAVFDIFRIENGKIVEHWDNMEPIPPRSEWKNTGKF